MIGILSVTGPIFALVTLGWCVTRFGLLDPATIRGLARYVINIALPALIFRAMTGHDLGALIDGPYFAAYLVGSLVTFALAYRVGRRLGLAGGAATFQGMGSSCSNTGFIGYPIVLIALPHAADAALALNMIVENLVMLPLILALAERTTGVGQGPVLGRTLRRLAGNPIVLGLVAGLAVAVSPFHVPAILAQSVNLIAMSSAAVSLIVIGGTLVGIPRAAIGGTVAAVVAGKLLAHPLAVAACFFALSLMGVALDRDLVEAGILLAAMPAMAIYPLLAAQYGEGPQAAVAMLGMTALSFFTVGGLVWALAAFG